MNISDITVNDFKALFVRDFPYLPVWQTGKTYFKGDIVYYINNFYQSKIDGNTSIPTDTYNWQLYNDNVMNYISDEDISGTYR